MFIRLRGLASASCQSMARIAIYRYVNLYTRIRAIRPSTCNVVHNAFGHLIIEHLIISKPMDGLDSPRDFLDLYVLLPDVSDQEISFQIRDLDLQISPLTFWTRTFRPLIIVLLYKI